MLSMHFFAISLLSSLRKLHLEIPESLLSDEFPGNISNVLKKNKVNV